MTDMEALHQLADDLRTAGYRVTERATKHGRELLACGGGIRGYAHTPSEDVNRRFRGRFGADNARAFDKWSTAPLFMALPCDLARLLPALTLLGSEEGERLSNRFICDEADNPFPYEPLPPDGVRDV